MRYARKMQVHAGVRASNESEIRDVGAHPEESPIGIDNEAEQRHKVHSLSETTYYRYRQKGMPCFTRRISSNNRLDSNSLAMTVAMNEINFR